MGESAEDDVNLLSNKRLSSLLRDLRELRERGSFCDAVLEVQSRRYLAHKAVLSSTSGYFRALFLGAPCSSMGPFVVDCVGANAFELALDFVYKGTVTVGSLADVGELHRGARSLGIVGLEEACSPFLPPPPPPPVPACPPAESVGELDAAEAARTGGAFGYGYGDVCYYDDGDHGGGGGPRSRPLRARRSPARRFGAGFARAARDRDPPGEPDPAAAAGDSEMKEEAPDELAYGDAGEAPAGPRFRDRAPTDSDPDEDVKPALVFLRAASPARNRFGDDDDRDEDDEEEEEDAEAAEPRALAVCRACGEAVEETVSALREHSCGHLDMERLACRLCAARFSNISDAVEHALAHTGAALLACRRCGHKFLSAEKLGAHARGQCKKRKYKGIGTRLSNVRQLKWRRQAAQAARAAPAERAACGACGAAVAGCMSDLRDHGLVHLDVENQRCRLCGYVSLYKSNLVKHSLVHIGVYLYSCAACRKSFLFKYEMDRHVCLKAKMEVVT